MFNTHQSRIDQQAAMLAALPAAKAAAATRESEPQINLPELIRKANADHAAHLKNNAELTQKRRIALTEKCASAYSKCVCLSTYSKSAADRLRRYKNEFDAISDMCMAEYPEGYDRWATFLRNDQQMSNDRDSIEIRRMEINRMDIIRAALQQSEIVYY